MRVDNILLTNAVPIAPGKAHIPLFQLLSLLSEPSLRHELLRAFEDVGVVVNRIEAHGNDRLPTLVTRVDRRNLFPLWEDEETYTTWDELASYMGSCGWNDSGKSIGCCRGYPDALFDYGSLRRSDR